MLRKALEAKDLQKEAKNHETGYRTVARSYRATSSVPGSVSRSILPTPTRPHDPIARLRGCEVKAATFVDRATARCTARPHALASLDKPTFENRLDVGLPCDRLLAGVSKVFPFALCYSVKEVGNGLFG
ncbi:hypothetical protein PIB30_017819 [Stylosanthes scabra]|uniref:Uncharacterized protein n=1 Tax=Stylosanthes scabra TaxID=79078 RepID=A0ABU6V6R7_9FABA|nr:hypothetical protein [Stylosanthes scabra]